MSQEIVDSKQKNEKQARAMTVAEIDKLLTESYLILKMNRERLKKYSED